MATITLEQTVGQLVTQRPSRSRVFESFGIDYCCGGKHPLGQACFDKGIDPQAVLKVLQLLDERPDGPQENWSNMSLAALCDHIEQTHHAYLKRELPRIEYLVNRVAQRHGQNQPHLGRLREVFLAMKAELESHMNKEERILFPMIRSLEADGTVAAVHCGSVSRSIGQMMVEHEDAGEALRQMRQLTGGYTPPADACNTYRAMYDALAELESDMHQHVHKENNILFPRAKELNPA
jgi:regulator of cell morphogenesis and NO signaling